MSHQYMKQAVRDRIRATVLTQINEFASQTTAGCELTDDDRPALPWQGEIFFAVHSGRRTNDNQHEGSYQLEETYYFYVTISLRTARSPRWRRGTMAIDDADTGIQFLADLVIRNLHGYLSLTEEANTLLAAADPSAQTFITGYIPRFLGCGDPVSVMGDWFGGSLDSQKAKSIQNIEVPAGLKLSLPFKGLKMIRNFTD